MGKCKTKAEIISLPRQRASLITTYKDSQCYLSHGNLVWSGRIKPSALSKEYKVKITYNTNKSPIVIVHGDELEQLDNKKFPHNYGVSINEKTVELCLYKYSEFNKTKFLTDTIIPWTVEWLYYYEIWLFTGEWYGGGDHPKKANKTP